MSGSIQALAVGCIQAGGMRVNFAEESTLTENRSKVRPQSMQLKALAEQP